MMDSKFKYYFQMKYIPLSSLNYFYRLKILGEKLICYSDRNYSIKSCVRVSTKTLIK